jgi:beta-1,4-mannosyl-glycoprotein beta-1,4-N-acetylglucosaminyltransferase
VYDCFTFDGEECLDLRLKAHWDEVDIFVIVEANITFSAVAKSYAFDAKKYEWARSKIRYIQVDAGEFEHCKTAWDREKYQRNAMQLGFQDAKPDDVVVISDVDEIIKPGTISDIAPGTVHILKQLTFYFYKNYLLISDPFWYKAIAVRGEVALKHTPEDLRNNSEVRASLMPLIRENAGWHFSYLGGHEMIEYKLSRFSHQNLNKPKFKNLKKNLLRIYEGKDIYWRAKRWARVESSSFGSKVIDEWFQSRPNLSSPLEITSAGSLQSILEQASARQGIRKQWYKLKLRIWNFF